MTDLVLTLIGPDRPGLVESVAAIVARNGGNWLESRMTRLAGKFAGILRAELPPDNVAAALAALAALEARGLKVVAEVVGRGAGPAAPGDGHRDDGHKAVVATDEASRPRMMSLELVGLDCPGIVREISQLLAANGVNVEELVTNRVSAPMSGETLFEARARVRFPGGADIAALRAALERLASDLMVDVKLEPVPPHAPS